MQEELKIKDIMAVLRKRVKSIFSITLVVGILSAVLNFYIAVPVYESSIRIFIGAKAGNRQESNINDMKAYKDLVSSYVEIIESDNLVDKAISRYNINRTSKDILENLKVEAISNTQVIELTYKDKDRYAVKEVLDSVSDEFIDEVEDITSDGDAKLIDKIEVPESPASPKKILNVGISVILAFILSCLLALFNENFTDKIKSISQVEKELKLDVIGVVPVYKKRKGEF